MLNLGVIMDRKLWLGTVLTWTLVCLCNTPVGAAWIDLGGDGVTVSLMESDGARSVIEITLGGFDAEPVDIDGQTYYLISLAREGLEKEAGYPELPSVRRSLIIPDDREMAVSVLSSEHVEFTDLPVAPSKGHLLRTVDPATVPYHFDAFYQSAGTYPAAAVEANAPYILRDYRGMVVDANVLQYSPATQTLRVYTRMVIEVRPVGPGSINVLERSGPIAKMDRQFTNLYRDHFLNFGADSRYMPVLEDGGLLIITYDAFLSSIQPLAAWKLQKGIPTKLVTLSDTGPSYSQIRNYILAEYQDWGLSYVLLVGDGAQLPKYGSDSDPGYSLLVGSDSYPEIFVGRFSAETPEHVVTQVQRTISYERDTVAGNGWLQEGTGIASNQGPGHYGEYDNQHMDLIRDDLLAYGYLEVDQIYDPSATSAMVSNALNAGRGIVNYCGHGSQTSWSTTGFGNTHVNALTNDDMLPFICSVACNNGTFTPGTCFAEAWMRATHNGQPTGAIACYMSYISQSWDPPMYAEDEAVDLLVADEMRTVGGLWFNGSCHMMDMTGASGENEFRNWTIFGDPSLAVRTKTAAEMMVNHLPIVPLGVSSFMVEVPEVAGATACLYRDGVIHGTAVTDASGHAEIVLDIPVLTPGEITLTVTAYNRVTYIVDLEAIVPAHVTIDPVSVPVGQVTPVTVTVADTNEVGLPDVTVWITGFGVAGLEQTTDASGVVQFDVEAQYGEILTVRGRENAVIYDLFTEALPVTGAAVLTSPDLTAEVPFLGLVGSLAPHYEGTVTGTAVEAGLTLYLSGCGVDTSFNDPTNLVVISVTPTMTGTLTAALAKNGFELFAAEFAVTDVYGTLAGGVYEEGSLDPIAGARIYGYSAGSDTTGILPLFDLITDGAGSYAVADSLAAGYYDLYVTKFGYLAGEEQIFLANGANSADVILVNAPSGVLTGTITSTEDGSPAVATVKLFRSDTGELFAEATSDSASGLYAIPALPYFSYDLTVKGRGFMPASTSVAIDQPEVLQNFVLDPLFVQCHSPGLPIADYYATTDVMTVALPAPIEYLEVFLDISHGDASDLVIELTSPQGTTVRLQSRTSVTAYGIYGWYPEELTPYGDLADFVDEEADGEWTLYIFDYGVGDSGTLNDWCLQITAPQIISDVDSDTGAGRHEAPALHSQVVGEVWQCGDGVQTAGTVARRLGEQLPGVTAEELDRRHRRGAVLGTGDGAGQNTAGSVDQDHVGTVGTVGKEDLFLAGEVTELGHVEVVIPPPPGCRLRRNSRLRQ